MVSTGRVQGTHLYYEVTGEGPPLVLVHSGGFDRRLWDEQFFTFADRYTVIRYDLRGHGQSPPPTKPYSDVEDLHLLLQWLRVEKAHLLGLSLGSSIVIDYTLAHPEMVATLLLVTPDVNGYTYSAEFNQEFVKLVLSIQEDDGTPAGDLRLQSPFFLPAMENPAVAQRLRLISRENARFWLSNLLLRRDAFTVPAAVQRLPELHTPTLLVVGDRLTPDMQNQAQLLESGIVGVKKVVIPGAGHLAHMEKPEEFNRALRNFLTAR